MAAAIEMDVDGRTVRISSPEKPIFPAAGLTKLDVVTYYLDVAESLLPHCLGRPCNLKRYPGGVEGKSFMQKRVPASRPPWLRTAQVTFGSGRTAEELCPASMADVLWSVNLGAITVHPWSLRLREARAVAGEARAVAGEDRAVAGEDRAVVGEDPDGNTPTLADDPDELRIDLDPMPESTWSSVTRVAETVNEVLAEHDIAGFVKTSGSTGMHVLVRVQPRPYVEVRAAAVALSREVERRLPEIASTSWWKEERGSQAVFLDYNQNLWDRTTACAYAVRATPDARVSLPITWGELHDVDPADATISTVPGLLAERGDPMATLDDVAYDLAGLVELSARDRDSGLDDLPLPPHYPKFPNEPTRVPPSRAADRD